MQLRDEIIARVDCLPPEMQERVLRFLTSLSVQTPQGEPGAALRASSGSLASVSAEEMMRAIEEECERVDDDEW